MKIVFKIFEVIEGSVNGKPFAKLLPALFLQYVAVDEFETEEAAIEAINKHGEEYCNYTVVKIIKT